MSRILIAEDEPRLASFLEKALRAEGYATWIASDGPAAARLALDEEFDLMILDLGLPLLDGLEVLRRLRGHDRGLPVIILTARGDPEQRVAGLEAGADDYMGKPFHLAELVARVRLRLRSAEPAPQPQEQLKAGGVALDLRTRWATVDGRSVELSRREFDLLHTFLQHPDQVLSREQLLARVWGYDYDPGSNVVDVYVGYLRRKLGPARLESVRGVGYRYRR